MDIALLDSARNAVTGRWGFARGADGDVAFDDTEAHAVVTSALEDLGAYWADPGHGSRLHALRNLTSRTPSQAEAMVRQAEQPLVQEGVISSFKTDASAELRSGRLRIELDWSTPSAGAQSKSVTV